MKLYVQPVSTTSRPVSSFAAENNIALEEQVVDLFKGEQLRPPFRQKARTSSPFHR